MIEVQHLTKRYGPFTAVDDISFSVDKGEILGFLGPNGAGKTTTMRVLTGYMQRLVSTAALVLVLGGLVGYIYYLDRKPAESAEGAKEKPFGTVKADDIEEIQITASGESTQLKKSDGAWKIVTPVQADADTNELTSLAGSLSTLEV